MPEKKTQQEEKQTEQQPLARVEPELKLDEAPEGGRYVVNGVLVDANGQPIKDNA